MIDDEIALERRVEKRTGIVGSREGDEGCELRLWLKA